MTHADNLVLAALQNRRSIRAFTDAPVQKDLLLQVFDCARMAPSGGNMQPWRAICVAGAARDALCRQAARWLDEGLGETDPDNPVYPDDLPANLVQRRFELGRDFYGHLGVDRKDAAGRAQWSARNYQFFGAPAGAFFISDRRYGHAQWAHLGMFIQSVTLAAAGLGLGSCLQEAWADFREELHDWFDLQPAEFVYCGMALGWPDADACINAFRPARMELSELVSFHT